MSLADAENTAPIVYLGELNIGADYVYPFTFDKGAVDEGFCEYVGSKGEYKDKGGDNLFFHYIYA